MRESFQATRARIEAAGYRLRAGVSSNGTGHLTWKWPNYRIEYQRITICGTQPRCSLDDATFVDCKTCLKMAPDVILGPSEIESQGSIREVLARLEV